MLLVSQVKGVIARRRVVETLVERDLRVRYAGSAIGYLWTILDPLAMSMIYFVVFTVIFKARTVGYQPYALFIIVGLLAWQWFSQSVTETSRALTAEARLIRSNSLPRELWVVRVVLAKGIEYVLSMPVMAGFAIYFMVLGEAHVNWRLVLIPLAIAIQFVLLVGIGLILAPVNVLFTDMARVVRIALRMGFYATPIIYGAHDAPPALRRVLEFNPFTGIVELYRAGFFPAELNLSAVLISAVMSASIFVVGTLVFKKLEPAVLKEI